MASSLASSLSSSMFKIPIYRVPFVFCCLHERKNASWSERSMARITIWKDWRRSQELGCDSIVDDFQLVIGPFGAQDAADQAYCLGVVFDDEDGVGGGRCPTLDEPGPLQAPSDRHDLADVQSRALGRFAQGCVHRPRVHGS